MVSHDRSWPGDATFRVLGLVALAGSIGAVALAPAAVAESYSSIENTISESAAQGVDGAWVGRSGFLLFGFAVLATTRWAGGRWGPVATACHLVFAAGQFAVAAFAARSWVDAAEFDRVEDSLHSIAATVIGVTFSVGVVAAAIRRRPRSWPALAPDAVAVLSATALPLVMLATPTFDGAVQRVMFATAYLWYGAELVRAPIGGARPT